MLDRNDPEYLALAEFLQSERKAFLEGQLRKEEERNKFDKLKKLNKTLSKTGMMWYINFETNSWLEMTSPDNFEATVGALMPFDLSEVFLIFLVDFAFFDNVFLLFPDSMLKDSLD